MWKNILGSNIRSEITNIFLVKDCARRHLCPWLPPDRRGTHVRFPATTEEGTTHIEALMYGFLQLQKKVQPI